MKPLDYIFPSIVAGMIIGLLISLVIIETDYQHSLGVKASGYVKECEASLPRNENCVIIAVPVKKEGEN